ncbi:unnamed protein product [Notodromas monacha]|uniref:5-formyltetrahydrofolate cyclo-ligase n=1 Tax=Notodromas monacha TaxID=399045 RepID=A0A7R9BSM5_9CRUS|nr:unnamed protein product [Notodromas monacha]CAG0919611.1 unnamed protein product [Notodromas monacha]
MFPVIAPGRFWLRPREQWCSTLRLMIIHFQSRAMSTLNEATNLRELKSIFRENVKRVLQDVSQAEIEKQSVIVLEKLCQVLSHPEYQRASRISVYISMPGEISTDELIRNILETGKKCYVPRFRNKDKRMDMVQVTSWEDFSSLPVVKWNIRQPSFDDERENALDSGGLDLVMCPGLAFSPNGRRIGRGMGFYDNFLKRCSDINDEFYSFGLALREQVVPNVPTGPNDCNVHEVITA